MESVLVNHPTGVTKGHIKLEGSKSISNRILIIRALSEENFSIDNLGASDDTDIMTNLLKQENATEYDAGHAGTCYRFMTAYLALQKGRQLLTGSERMKERPIGPLVDALRSLGVPIEYIENEGYPPLSIGEFNPDQYNRDVKISGSVSSQYLSALLMIAPLLPNGLCMHIQESLVSRPYLEMTLRIMEEFGIQYDWSDEMTIDIQQQGYKGKPFVVESDWSAASYYFSIAALSKETDILLEGLFENSLQGDSAIVDIAKSFGVIGTYENGFWRLTKDDSLRKEMYEYNFIKQPDLAQTVAVMAAGTGVYSVFTGLETLKIKETDRIEALRNELGKFQVYLSKLPAKFSPKSGVEFYAISGTITADAEINVETYKDHRMAMAFAPIGLLQGLTILKPKVVSKSYAGYWDDLRRLGFELTFSHVADV